MDIPVDQVVSCEGQILASVLGGDTDVLKDCSRVGSYLRLLQGQSDQYTPSTKCLFCEEIGKTLQIALLPS